MADLFVQPLTLQMMRLSSPRRTLKETKEAEKAGTGGKSDEATVLDAVIWVLKDCWMEKPDIRASGAPSSE